MMNSTKIRFGAFVAVVLLLPASLMATGDPRLVDLGKLAMILAPGPAGLLLNRGLGDRSHPARWGWVGIAVTMTLAVAGGALAVAWAAGAAEFHGNGASIRAILAAAGVSALTSALEELGWAGGGLALVIGAFGRRPGTLFPSSCGWASFRTWRQVPPA